MARERDRAPQIRTTDYPACTTSNMHYPACTTCNMHYPARTTCNMHYPACTTSNMHYPACTTSNMHYPACTTSNMHYPARTTSNMHYPARTTCNIHYPACTTCNMLVEHVEVLSIKPQKTRHTGLVRSRWWCPATPELKRHPLSHAWPDVPRHHHRPAVTFLPATQCLVSRTTACTLLHTVCIFNIFLIFYSFIFFL